VSEQRKGTLMQLVERHVIKCADPRFATIDAASFASKNVYNAANHMVRQSYIHEFAYLNYHDMDRRIQDHEAYRALPAKVAQWVLRLLEKKWESYFAALAAWQTDPVRAARRLTIDQHWAIEAGDPRRRLMAGRHRGRRAQQASATGRQTRNCVDEISRRCDTILRFACG